MSATAETLVAEYFRSGTLSGLPKDHYIDGRFTPPIERGKPRDP